MPLSKKNVLTHGLSGTMGELMVFIQKNGKTFVGNVPKERSVPLSEKQLAVNERFKLASAYAKNVLADPDAKMRYEAFRKIGQTSYNVAFADYFLPPKLSNPQGVYDGLVGTELGIRALDNYGIETVLVVITAANGDLIEQGPAVKQTNGIDWTYTCMVGNENTAGCKATWQAQDFPGNKTQLEVEV